MKPNGIPYSFTTYILARVYQVAPVVSGYDCVRFHKPMLSAEQEKAIPRLNRRSRLGSYQTLTDTVWTATSRVTGLPVTMSTRPESGISDADMVQMQDRLTQLRQYAKLAGIRINGKDYSKTLSVRGKSSTKGSGMGAEFDVTHTTRWDGGKYDAAAAKRAADKAALAADRNLYPFMYDARGKRREIRISPLTGSCYFGPKGRTISLPQLVAEYESKSKAQGCEQACKDAAMLSSIRLAQSIREGAIELDSLIREQKADARAQKRGKALTVTIRDLIA